MINGYLITKAGTKHRVEQGLIRWTQDVDGNKLLSYIPAYDPIYAGN